MKDECDFSFEHYLKTIERYKSSGYKFYTFTKFLNENPKGKVILLRHDVDIAMTTVQYMLKAEVDAGVESTWFFRTHARGYNPLFRPFYETIRQCSVLGEVGLHYEPSYRDFKLSREIIEGITHTPVRCYSVHDPRRVKVVEDIGFCQRMDYDVLKYLKFTYVSDSGHDWRDGCWCKHVNKYKRLAVLTHPEFWTTDKDYPGEAY